VLLDIKWTLNPSKFTSTRTIFTMTCGGVDLTATFLTPIEVRTPSITDLQPGCDLTKAQPTDLVNQSIPFSYLSVEVVSNDGKPHKVQLYTDISGEWLAQSDQAFAWETVTGSTVNHRFWLQNQTQATEVNGRLRDGYVMYSTKQVTHFRQILSGSFSKHSRSAG